ncbi:hypothetical protein L6164_011879 [Bauhinia variegata]|uniref:Uncharacterized protein n=1 Tax=Bauhinia variegata TaxID=167791 RepID=A0ACB9P8M7_BAUVA|nr:hypothetical protein L6164_011879 [Bauhinia variegata]
MAEVAFGVSPQPSFFVRPRTSGIRSQGSSSICFWSLGGGARRLQLEPQSPSLAFSHRSSPTSPLNYFRDRLYTGVVSSDFKASTPTTVDTDQPELDSGGGAGDGIGDKNGGGGGGGGDGGGDNNGGDSNKGEEGSEGDKKKMAILMSQKFTLGYAALVGGNR